MSWHSFFLSHYWSPSMLSELVDCYTSTLSQLLNKHLPLKSKIICTKPRNPWYTQALKNLNLLNVILNVSGLVYTHSFKDLKNLLSATNHYHAAIINAKRLFSPLCVYVVYFRHDTIIAYKDIGVFLPINSFRHYESTHSDVHIPYMPAAYDWNALRFWTPLSYRALR